MAKSDDLTELSDVNDTTASNFKELLYSKPNIYFKDGKLSDLITAPRTLGKRTLPEFLSSDADSLLALAQHAKRQKTNPDQPISGVHKTLIFA